MSLDDFLLTRYERGARGPSAYDCWGLVRAARCVLFGRPELPSLTGVEPGDFPAITMAFCELSASLSVARPNPGAIASAFIGKFCVHVGLCVELDGRTFILETDEKTGPALTARRVFESRYLRVVYHDD